MDKVFRPYCPCKQINEDHSNVCVVCGKPFDIDNEYEGENELFCSCQQPVHREMTDNCVICGKSFKDYIMSKMSEAATSFCLCVAMTKTRENNTCEVCDKPKPLNKKDVFCFCEEPTATNEEKVCITCGKPKFFKLEYKKPRCRCVEVTKTDRDENCVVCHKRKLFDDAVKYCYKKEQCLHANASRLTSCVPNRVYCPLRHINWCPWIGDFDKVAEHCKNNHARNFFEREATIQCPAHLREYTESNHYFTTDFLINVHDKLFKCSFEINPKGLMKWSTVILQKESEAAVEDSNQTYRFFIEFINSTNQHIYWDAYCVKESAPIFEDFITSVKMHKDLLRPFCDEAKNFLYRIFIIHIPRTPQGVLANYYEMSRSYFLLNWLDYTLPECTAYEDNCKCVKTAVDNC